MGSTSFEYTMENCVATASGSGDLAIVGGNAGDVLDAWGREASTMRFSLELTGTADNSVTVTPGVTLTWS
jgi:hypothetical protein